MHFSFKKEENRKNKLKNFIQYIYMYIKLYYKKKPHSPYYTLTPRLPPFENTPQSIQTTRVPKRS